MEITSLLEVLFDRSLSVVGDSVFSPDSHWRDLCTFFGCFKTIDELDSIAMASLVKLKLVEEEAELISVLHDGHFIFRTRAFHGRGYVGINSDGEITTFFTFATSIITAGRRTSGLSDGAFRMSFHEQYNVVIVGAGQAGLALSARLKKLGVERVVVLEKNDRIGDNWRSRYESLHLHDPKNACALPFIAMPETFPKFVPKDQVGDFLESYASLLSLHVRLNTSVEPGGASFDETSKLWSLKVKTGQETSVITARHFVIATGLSGFPRFPELKGSDTFQGKIIHSSHFSGYEAPTNVVVIGSNTSAHDIAQALTEKGSNVVMVQRSATTVVSLDSHAGIIMNPFNGGAPRGSSDPLFNASLGENELLDLEIAGFHSNTYRKLATISREVVVPAIKAHDKDLLTGLDAVGMKLDWGEDESGLLMKFLRRGSGYYMSIGASELIVAGKIKVVQLGNSEIELEENSVVVGGESLPADLVVAATGYTNMSSWTHYLCGATIGEKVGHIGGYGSETRDDPGPYVGEMRNMWGKTEQEGLWYFCGNFTQCRFYSLQTAILIQIELAGGWDAVRGVVG